ncbi:hypothetical protein Aca07nite_55180 [Actinoplanes capillaceus]|uniref:Uncharacterized protein n=1 Tax=Actinoplanes campanulatus TaxID=113559 RepID=A0ABQ3WPW9_9ACTN|nr:hypothetical protein [Actinoplanes capillaceus]GID48243.1 hypothetical protein Aca07nite_55180 [Actinoplanes capillaceus]
MVARFELVVEFRSAQAAVAAADRVVAAGNAPIDLHWPRLDRDGDTTLLLSVVPVVDGARTARWFTDLGNGLYRLLSDLTGYRAALAGWDPLSPLRERRQVPGLVLPEPGDGPGFVPFARGFVWLPYRGERQ